MKTPPWRSVVEAMERIVEDRFLEIGLDRALLSPVEAFRWIEAIPYRADPEVWVMESLATPGVAASLPFLDCKKKAMLAASWATYRGIPWRFCVVQYPGDSAPSHVYVEAFLRPTAKFRRVGDIFPEKEYVTYDATKAGYVPMGAKVPGYIWRRRKRWIEPVRDD